MTCAAMSERANTLHPSPRASAKCSSSVRRRDINWKTDASRDRLVASLPHNTGGTIFNKISVTKLAT